MAIKFIPTPDQIKALEAQHDGVWEIKVGESIVLFRCPTELEFRSFVGNSLNDRKKIDAAEILTRDVVVFPSPNEFAQIIAKYPGANLRIATAANEVADGGEVTQAKKPVLPLSVPAAISS